MDIKAMPSFSLLMGNRRPFNRLPDLERRLAGSHEGMGDGLWPAFFNKDRILFKKKKIIIPVCSKMYLVWSSGGDSSTWNIYTKQI